MSRGFKAVLLILVLAAIGGLAALVIQDRLHPTIDKNGDGKPDEWFTYNLKGELVSLKKDRNFDGKIDYIESYKNGKISVLMVDMNGNGVFEAILHYDDQGRMETLERDLDDDGKIDRIIHYDPVSQLQTWTEDKTR